MHADRPKRRFAGSAVLRPVCLAFGLICLGGLTASRADNFRRAYYDPATDELVLVVVYTGAHRDHQFNLKWDPCKTLDGGGREMAGELLDRQWDDVGRKSHTKTLRFSVADLNCRPAVLTVRTAPRFYVTVTVPAQGASAPAH